MREMVEYFQNTSPQCLNYTINKQWIGALEKTRKGMISLPRFETYGSTDYNKTYPSGVFSLVCTALKASITENTVYVCFKDQGRGLVGGLAGKNIHSWIENDVVQFCNNQIGPLAGMSLFGPARAWADILSTPNSADSSMLHKMLVHHFTSESQPARLSENDVVVDYGANSAILVIETNISASDHQFYIHMQVVDGLRVAYPSINWIGVWLDGYK